MGSKHHSSLWQLFAITLSHSNPWSHRNPDLHFFAWTKRSLLDAGCYITWISVLVAIPSFSEGSCLMQRIRSLGLNLKSGFLCRETVTERLTQASEFQLKFSLTAILNLILFNQHPWSRNTKPASLFSSPANDKGATEIEIYTTTTVTRSWWHGVFFTWLNWQNNNFIHLLDKRVK